MFVQVIEGKVKDAEAAQRSLDRWRDEVADGAIGWLGATAGVTDDGTRLVVARFSSAAEAQQNSDRPEQDAWWREMAATYDGEPTFAESEDVVVDAHGDLDSAGFVQVVRGAVSDVEKLRSMMAFDSERWADYRPDVLGTVIAFHPDGQYTMVGYFTSEAEARVGERKEPPPELAAEMAAMNELEVGEPRYYDLRDPQIYSAD